MIVSCTVMMFSSWYLFFLLLLQPAVSTTLSRWPKGLYGLLKPKTGCPSGWTDNGWVFHNTKPSNKSSEVLHIEGLVGQSYVISHFCIKTSETTTSTWPKGRYCIYTKLKIHGLNRGRISMYNNLNSLVDSTCKKYFAYSYNHGRRIDLIFYCNLNGDRKIPIELPITKPFYLLPYGSRECQQVKWMVATTEWIKYNTQNYFGRRWQEDGKVPYREYGSRMKTGITMFYCYYQSCNYTLNETTGVFQSPGFPDKYPDGQLCSWRIMVPANHIIHVHFTNFSLCDNDENDSLIFYTQLNGSFQLNHAFHGEKRPFTIKATNNVLIEFLTNKENTSTGFRAEYIIFLPKVPAATTTSIPGASKQHTTIHATTMTKNESSNRTSNKGFMKLRIVDCDCDGTWTTIAVVIPLVCLTVVIVIAIIYFRWRSNERSCEKCQPRFNSENAVNPTYGQAKSQRMSTATMNTTLDANDGQMYEALSRDKQSEYEAPDYSKQDGRADLNIEPDCPEYHELEPMDNDVPDVVYDVLEGPVVNGPSDDQTYQALDKRITHDPLYQSTMMTRNQVDIDSDA